MWLEFQRMDCACIELLQAQQTLKSGRLARTVQSNQAMNGATSHTQIQSAQYLMTAIVLHQAIN